MSELTLLAFRIAFLIALWVFVFFVVYAVRSDLFGEKVKRLVAPRASQSAGEKAVFLPAAHAANSSTTQVTIAPTPGQLTLYVISGPKQGEAISLTTEPLTIGRSSDSSIVIRDDYTSTHHARLEYRAGTWLLNDLGSTNGTFISGKKISEPTEIGVNVPFTVGSTTFEIRPQR
jgi:hypothetical protein